MPEDVSALDPVVVAFLQQAAATPDRRALAAGSESLRYGELARCTIEASALLLEQGVGVGDRVLIAASSSPAFVVAYLALHLARAIVVPIDPAIPALRRDDLRSRVRARLVLQRDDVQALFTTARDAAASRRDLALVAPPPALDDDADIMFTSGTTGSPKGVVLTQRNLAAGARQINAAVGARSGDVEVLPLPLNTSFGLGSVRCLLGIGGTVVLVDGFAFPGRVVQAIAEHRATSFRAVPAGVAMLLRFAPDQLAGFADQLRYIELGSAPMPLADKHRLMQLLPRTRLHMHYGLTESTRSVWIEFHADATRLHTVGRPAPGVELAVVGENGAPAPPGEQGEICMRGPHVMRGYWEEPARTRATLVDGWLHTGDLGALDAEGCLVLHGRGSDMINVGGRKVSPVEVEDALRTHPAVRDCGCTAIADPNGVAGDAVAVVVLLNEGMTADRHALRDHLRERLEPHKLPVRWSFGGPLPRTANGKLQRHLLRQRLESGVESRP